MPAGVLSKLLRARAAAMRYFGLTPVENMMCGRSIPKATSSRRLKLSYGKMKLSLALILIWMVTPVYSQ